MNRLTFVRPLVRALVQNPTTPWQYQGFGMLRIYPAAPDTRVRLNVWVPELAVPGVSVIHNHPWSFTSLIVAGNLMNHRFRPVGLAQLGKRYDFATITPGPGGGMGDPGGFAFLEEYSTEAYVSGQTYSQKASEIHYTSALPGTVTINERLRQRGAKDVAQVFWPSEESWVSAEPRPATKEEIAVAREAALRWLEMPV